MMKLVYLLAVIGPALMIMTLYQDRTKWMQPTIEYAEECAKKYGGTTFLVRSTSNEIVLLCINTDVFLLGPKIISD